MKDILFRSVFLLAFSLLTSSLSGQTKEIAAYFPEWGVEHQPYYIKHIETNGAADKLTVLIYAFCEPVLDSSGNVIPEFKKAYQAYQQVYTADMSIDRIADDSTHSLRGHFNQIKKLKSRHPQLRVILSIGGWTGSNYLSDAALTLESREKFVDAVIDRYILGNLPEVNHAGGVGAAKGIFDGIDFDWEYPLEGGNTGIHHNKGDKDNLTELYKIFRSKLDKVNPKLLLTAAVPAVESNASQFNISEDQKYLDWYNLMTYDYAGGWSSLTGHHTNLLSAADPSSGKLNVSFDNSVRLFMDKFNVSPDKIMPGAAFYGRGWKEVEALNAGLNQAGKAAMGIYEEGFNYYPEVISLLLKGYEYNWDNHSMAATLYNRSEKVFWTLDDEKSVALKARYVDAFNLRGLMLWDISGDDQKGSLINAIYSRNMPDVKIKPLKAGRSALQIKITEPQKGCKLNEGANVVINTSSVTKRDSIMKVEFFADGKSLGYDTRLPFSWVWFNIPTGNHKITAMATDSRGMVSKSGAVNVVVVRKK